MKFFEKLDILMKVTDTSNTRLGRAVSFDASYISRIRSGKRNAPKNREFLETVSEYFVKNTDDIYRRKILTDFICPDKEWPSDSAEAKNLILSWLMKSDNDPLILDSEAEKQEIGKVPSPSYDTETDAADCQGSENDVSFFYGNEGKRQAVEEFLSSLCEMNKPSTIFLCSTEEFDWMYEKPAFAKKWAYLMKKFILQGGKIKIIHTISRSSSEMITALQKWIPLYMTGAIEPYYYPKLRDRVYRRTLFVAPDNFAVVSNSVQEKTESSLNLLIRRKEAVRALEKEFSDYLKLCRPLLNTYDILNRDGFYDLLKTFEESGDELIRAIPAPSFALLPESFEKELFAHCRRRDYIKLFRDYKENFSERISSGDVFTEILHLPDIETIKKSSIHVPMSEIFGCRDLIYKAEDLKKHLINTVNYIKEHENYHVVLSDKIPQNQIIYVKEDFGAIVIKANSPVSAFGISESRLTAAFWDFLSRLSEDLYDRDKTLKALNDYINML